jgi:tRNA A-37 threonylcarbamoyl transferase component Bud32
MITRRHLVLPGEAFDRPSDTHSVEPIEQVRGALANAYGVEAEIGRGGMGRVYLASDRRHRRLVAIKVLHAEVATAMGRDRFAREIAIAASLVHPNILPLYDSGSIGGLLYYVMPYVEGESLRARLEREGQFRLQDATAIASDVAAALDHAHGRGIVHRDVKPENILLLSGHALLADFGLAVTNGGNRRTLSGHVVGTPAYMSPEQGAPGGQVDARADIYALGCVVYEMLAGAPRRGSRAATAHASPGNLPRAGTGAVQRPGQVAFRASGGGGPPRGRAGQGESCPGVAAAPASRPPAAASTGGIAPGRLASACPRAPASCGLPSGTRRWAATVGGGVRQSHRRPDAGSIR